MEEDEIEMSKEELQKWIKGQVEKSMQVSSGGKEKYSLLMSLLEKKRRQTEKLLDLCQSVTACEKTVKELYSLLGWEYSNSDSGYSDAEPTSCRRTLPFLFVSAERHKCKSSTSKTTTRRSSESDEDEDNEENHKQHMGHVGRKKPVVLMKEAVVVLNKLSRDEINAAVNLPSHQIDSSEDNTSSSVESDMQWEPEVDTSDSDLSGLHLNTSSVKRRKLHQNHKEHKKTNRTCRRARRRAAKISESETSTSSIRNSSSPECNVRKAPTLQATSSADAKRNAAEKATLPSNATNTKPKASTAKTTESSKSKTSLLANGTTAKFNQSQTTPKVNTTSQATTTNSTPPQGDAKASPESNAVKASTFSANIKEVTPVSQQPSTATSTSSNVPLDKITVNMNVLAKRRSLSWHPGKIAEIVTKENGKVKYKVVFEERGRLLVSGHHIAFASLPKVNHLFVGSRVVIKCGKDQAEFKPGIMAELPNRKNRMRFMVFIDDHTPVYIGLPSVRLVCKPLADPLDDILDDGHRSYMKEYLRTWPYPPQTQYKVGQKLKAEYEGVQQTCEILAVDCSLIHVVFEDDQHKEWIYRGSIRLEHMINMIQHMEGKKNEEEKKNNKEATK